MIRLSDSVLIDVPPERVWAWLAELPAHYREWHPDHVACWYERGKPLTVGAVLCVEERLHQRLHRLRLQTTEVVPGRLIRYRTRVFAGAFAVDPANGGTRFTAELTFGISAPVIGRLVDIILRAAAGRRVAAVRTHVREEGENLKGLLEREARRR